MLLLCISRYLCIFVVASFIILFLLFLVLPLVIYGVKVFISNLSRGTDKFFIFISVCDKEYVSQVCNYYQIKHFVNLFLDFLLQIRVSQSVRLGG